MKELNPTVAKMTYDLSDLLSYIDSLPELALLVLDSHSHQYTPYAKHWIKDNITSHLQGLATRQ